MLERHSAAVGEERNSRKQPLADDEAQQLINDVDLVHVARGKKVRQLASGDASPDDLKGPTGNYRAPMIRSGQDLLVGFHPETLEGLLRAG
ncbi:MAG: hypothetical protein AAF657_12005 [Acidobacteriota bacterium]